MSNETTFPAGLAEALAEAGIKQKDLAQRLGMGPSQLSRYVTGSREPGIETVERIGETLGGVFTVGVGGVRFYSIESLFDALEESLCEARLKLEDEDGPVMLVDYLSYDVDNITRGREEISLIVDQVFGSLAR